MSEQQSRTSDHHPFQYEKGVFVSYAWGGELEEFVNQIQQVLQARGIKLIRDKRDLGFKGSIRKFMERMGRGTCIIVVINDGYLRSKHCMFELMEIAEAEQFHDRVFPVVLGDTDIYDPVKIIGYVKYWEEKKAELTEAVKSIDQANLQGIHDEIDLYDRIRDEISGLISTLNDMNILKLGPHQESGYAMLADAIADRIGANDSVQQETIQDRRLDADMLPPAPAFAAITPSSTELTAKPVDSQLDDKTEGNQLLSRNQWNLSPAILATIFVGIIGAAAAIIASLIQIAPAVVNIFNSPRVPVSPTPACVTTDDILVRLNIWKGPLRIATLAPLEKIPLEQGVTLDLDVEIRSVSAKPLPTFDCVWTNTGTATDGKLIHQTGCNVDYKSGKPRIVDTLSLQLSQPSCSALPLYTFFVSDQ